MSSAIKKTKLKKISQQELRKMAQAMRQKRSEPSLQAAAATDMYNHNPMKRPTTTSFATTRDAKKMKIDSQEREMLKRKLEDLKRRAAEPIKKKKKDQEKPKSILKNSATALVAGYSDSDSEDEPPARQADEKKAKGEAVDEGKNEKGGGGSKPKLPEGFFDDADVDARAQGKQTQAEVMEREWESFQREVRHEEGESAAMVDEEQKRDDCDRHIDDIDKQVEMYQQLDSMLQLQDDMLQRRDTAEADGEDHSDDDRENASSDDDSDFDIDDWRCKNPFS